MKSLPTMIFVENILCGPDHWTAFELLIVVGGIAFFTGFALGFVAKTLQPTTPQDTDTQEDT